MYNNIYSFLYQRRILNKRNKCIKASLGAGQETTWRRTVKRECTEAGWRSWEEVKTFIANRDKWKDSVKALRATRHEKDRWGEVRCEVRGQDNDKHGLSLLELIVF